MFSWTKKPDASGRPEGAAAPLSLDEKMQAAVANAAVENAVPAPAAPAARNAMPPLTAMGAASGNGNGSSAPKGGAGQQANRPVAQASQPVVQIQPHPPQTKPSSSTPRTYLAVRGDCPCGEPAAAHAPTGRLRKAESVGASNMATPRRCLRCWAKSSG